MTQSQASAPGAVTASTNTLVLDIQGGNLTPGTPVIIWTTNSPPSPNQLWALTSDGHIQSQGNSNLVLDIKGGNLTAGTPVIVWTKNSPPTKNQLWTLTNDGHIQSQGNPNLVLDITGGKLTAGTPVEVWTKNSPPSPNQLWTFGGDGHIQSQAAPGVITIHNQGGYVARCTIEFDFNGQHHSQSSGDLLNPQTYSVPIPLGATNIHVKCEDATGLAWEPWKTVVDQTYPYPVLESFTLTGTTLNPSFSVEAGTGLTKQVTFTFINDINKPVYAAVHHTGCAGLPWRDGKAKCWDQTIQPNMSATYPPSDWVTHFSLWATLIADGLLCIVTIAITVATAGAAAPAAAAAGELTAEAAAEVAAETVGETTAEAAAESASSSAAVTSSIETAASETAFTRVASSLGMDVKEFAEAVEPYVQLAQKYGSAAAKVGTVVKDAVLAAVAVNSYKALESQGWALYVEVDGHGYYVSNYIVSGGNFYIPISLAISGLEVAVHNQGGYVARCTVEYDAGGQHQSQSSDNFNVGQSFAVLVPPGATNIHVICEEETGLAWEPWRRFVDRTYPGPAKLGTHKTFTLTGTTLNPTYGEEGVTQQPPTPTGKPAAPSGQVAIHNQGGYVARCSVEYDVAGQHQSQSSGNFNVGQSYSVAIPAGATNIHVVCQDETGLVWDPWKTIIDKTYSTPSQKTINLTGTTLSPGFNEQ